MATQGDRSDVRIPDIEPATLPEIGIPRQRAAEMKRMAAVGELTVQEWADHIAEWVRLTDEKVRQVDAPNAQPAEKGQRKAAKDEKPGQLAQLSGVGSARVHVLPHLWMKRLVDRLPSAGEKRGDRRIISRNP